MSCLSLAYLCEFDSRRDQKSIAFEHLLIDDAKNKQTITSLNAKVCLICALWCCVCLVLLCVSCCVPCGTVCALCCCVCALWHCLCLVVLCVPCGTANELCVAVCAFVLLCALSCCVPCLAVCALRCCVFVVLTSHQIRQMALTIEETQTMRDDLDMWRSKVVL